MLEFNRLNKVYRPVAWSWFKDQLYRIQLVTRGPEQKLYTIGKYLVYGRLRMENDGEASTFTVQFQQNSQLSFSALPYQ